MTPEEAARIALVEDLRKLAMKTDFDDIRATTLLKQAATFIEDLADRLDYRTADRLSDALWKTTATIVTEEDPVWGWQAVRHPMTVNNDSFQFVIEGSRHKWEIKAERREIDKAERTDRFAFPEDASGSDSES